MKSKIQINWRVRLIALSAVFWCIGLCDMTWLDAFLPSTPSDTDTTSIIPVALSVGVPIAEASMTYVPSEKAGMTPPKALVNAPVHVRLFIKRWLPVAADMSKRYNLHISAQLAQAGKESGWGNSKLATSVNNYFGIKCKYAKHNHDKCLAYGDGHFVKYATAWDSWKHHAQFMTGARYKKCMEKDSPFSYNICIAKSGYCPDAGYGEGINSIIAQYGLDAFDGLTKDEAIRVADKIKI